jgi:hypothetical protein
MYSNIIILRGKPIESFTTKLNLTLSGQIN